jgi:hypothetical protein
MAKAKSLKKKPSKKTVTGRPRGKMGRSVVAIDWKAVDHYLNAGCSGIQISCHLGIHFRTLYERCHGDHGIPWDEYLHNKKSQGHLMVLYKQFSKAVSGDNSMLIWVGKQQLGQRDEMKTTHQFDGKLGNLLDNLKNIKSEEDFENKDVKNSDES